MKCTRKLWLTACVASFSLPAFAQAPASPAEVPAFRSNVIKAVLGQITKKHYAPRPINDVLAGDVYTKFIYSLDPGSNIFLREDLESLSAQRLRIDDQLLAHQTTFFDSASAIFGRRSGETRQLVERLIARPFDYSRKATVVAARKELPFPASQQEKEETWRKLLQYYTLVNYMQLRAAAGDSVVRETKIDMAVEAQAREKVAKWMREQFASQAGPKAQHEQFTQYMGALALAMDPHTTYSGPKDRSFQQALSKQFFGLGIMLGTKDADFFVKELHPGGPAALSGQIQLNDNILEVSNDSGRLVAVTGLPAKDVAAMIRGEQGTVVKLLLQQPGQKARQVSVARGEVLDMENRAKSAVIERNGKRFGYLHLPMFYVSNSKKANGSAQDVTNEVVKLMEEQVEGIVFDLRGNGGGSLNEVVRMSANFLPGGPLSYLRGKDSTQQHAVPAGGLNLKVPLTILIDEFSASASEIFAAGMQDYGRGIVVGTSSTYGKGTAQRTEPMGKMGDEEKGIPPLSYGSLQLTVNKFYRVTGASTQKKGVISDIVLQDRTHSVMVREQYLPFVLEFDTISCPPFQLFHANYDKAAVIARARARVANNPGFKHAAAVLALQQQRAEGPAPLHFAAFKAYHEAAAKQTHLLEQAQRLHGADTLNARMAVFQSISPALRDNEEYIRKHTEWLNKVKSDAYIAATLLVLEDMINGIK